MNGKTFAKASGLRILAVCFLAFLMFFTVTDIRLMIEPIEKLAKGQSTFSDFTGEIRSAYTSGFLGKNRFVSLNGIFARTTGRRVCNEVLLLNNGMLSYERMDAYDTVPNAEKIAEFATLLSDDGIPFLYVQAPAKMDLKGELLPEGMTNSGNANADQMLDALRKGGVNALDLRAFLSENAVEVAQNFFRTDHHWNAEGAFKGFRSVAQAILDQFPGQNDGRFLDISQWDRHVMPEWFLGSHGKRVGPYFAGTDDLVYYTPKNDPVMSFALPKYNRLLKGGFADANLRKKYIEKKPGYFRDNAYCLFIGGDYPLTQHRNASAPSGLKLLVIGESFMLPMQGFLSTVFQEIDVVDPRHFSECSLAEYAKRTRPDMVVMMLNPGALNNSMFFSFGVEEIRKKESENHLLKSALPGGQFGIEDGFAPKASGKLATLSFALEKGRVLPQEATLRMEGLMADGTAYTADIPAHDFARAEARYACSLRLPRGLAQLRRLSLLPEGSLMMIEPKFELGRNATPWTAVPTERGDGLKFHLNDADIEIVETDKNPNFAIASAGLENGRTYTLSFQNVRVVKGKTQGVAAALYDEKSEQIVRSSVFDIEYCQENGGFSWTFSAPEQSVGALKLLLYAGLPEETKGIRICYEGVSLREGYSA